MTQTIIFVCASVLAVLSLYLLFMLAKLSITLETTKGDLVTEQMNLIAQRMKVTDLQRIIDTQVVLDQPTLDKMANQGRVIAGFQDIENQFGLWFRNNPIGHVIGTYAANSWPEKVLALLNYMLVLDKAETERRNRQVAGWGQS